MRTKKIGAGLDRRTLLRGAIDGVSACLALPLLDAMLNNNGTALAQGAALPVRFGTWWWGSGMRPAQWVPKATGSGNAWTLSEELLPLLKVKERLSVVTGMFSAPDGTVHHAGATAMLTGAGPLSIAGGTTAALPSIDVVVKRAWAGKTKFDALHIAVDRSPFSGEGTTPNDISHNGPNSYNPGEQSARRLFDRLFQDPAAGADSVAAARSARARKSVLDVVNSDAQSLRVRLGARDQARLDEHMTAIREIERRLETSGSAPAVGGCKVPARPEALAPVRSEIKVHNRALADVLSVALACDLTRVFSYQFFTWYAPVLSQLGHTEDFHIMTHNEGGDQPRIHAGVIFIMQELAYLLEKLQGITEGAGTLLDNCAVMAMSEVSEGRNHSREDMPLLVAGRAGGKLKGDVHVRGNRGNPSTVHLSVLNAIGLPLKEFGMGASRATTTLGSLSV